MASRLFSALCATAVISAPAVLAQDSIARCSLSFSSAGSANSVAVAAEVAEQTSVFVCDPEGPLAGGSITATATAVAEATATACAQAVASATVQCFAEGNSEFRVNGRSLAEAEAFAFAQAYASALGTAEDCNRCQTAASFVGQQAELIWLEATARLEVRLAEAATPGTPVAVAFSAFVGEFVEATASAFAQVLVQAKVSAEEEGCSVDIEGDVIVDANTGDNIPPSSISCEVNTTGISSGFAQDVVANASASVDVFACKNTTEIVANITASEYATAVANAIAAIAAECTVSGGGFACVWANSSIATVVEATAAAFADAYATSVRTCKPECAVNVTDFSATIVTIVAAASADAYLDQCAGPNSSFNITIIEAELVSRTVKAVATAIATAGIDNGTCIATAVARTDIVDVGSTMTNTSVVTKTPPPPMMPPPTPPPVKKTPPPPPVKKPPPPPPVKKPPPPPPVKKVAPAPPVKKIPTPVKKVAAPSKSAPIVTTKSTSTSEKTPTSTAKTRTTTTVVIDNPEHIKPGTFVATSSSSAKATVVQKACAPKCVAKFHQCAGSGMTGTSSCCDSGFVCMKKNANYAQCLPSATSHVYTNDDWAKTVMSCKHY